MPHESFNTIPLPSFAFADIVNRKAKQFCTTRMRGPLFSIRDDSERVQKELCDLNNDADRVQFLGYVINHIVEVIAKHEEECKEQYCQVDEKGQEFLYFLYGKLEDNGLKVNDEAFSISEVVEKDIAIEEIVYKLDEIKAGEHILFDDIQGLTNSIDDLKTDITELKNLYALGKKKWHHQLTGIIAENITNKGIDEVIKAISPELRKLAHEIFISFLSGKNLLS